MVKIIDGDRDAAGKGGVVSEEREQDFKSGAIEDFDLRSAAGPWSSNDVFDAIVVKISGGDKYAAGEVGIIGEEVCNAVAGLSIEDLDMGPAPCPRSDNDVAVGARVMTESDANFACEAGMGVRVLAKGALRVAVKVDLGTRDGTLGAGGEVAGGDEGLNGESAGFTAEAVGVADGVPGSVVGGVLATVEGNDLDADESRIMEGDSAPITGPTGNTEKAVLINAGVRACFVILVRTD